MFVSVMATFLAVAVGKPGIEEAGESPATQTEPGTTSEDSELSKDTEDNAGSVDEGPIEQNEKGALETEQSIRCSPLELGEKDSDVAVIYRVDKGRLGQRCYGEDEVIVLEAWAAMHEFANPVDLEAVRLFAGITSKSVAAFTVGVGRWPYDEFAIAVDLSSARSDPEELRLTMAHELSHVFAEMPDQSTKDSYNECATYHNGFFCFRADSYVYEWIDEFWSEDRLSALPRDGTNDEGGGYDRCEIDPSFLGSYAASHPEEDLAEAFSAFVFGVEVDAAAQPRLDFFLNYPELAIYRDRAVAAGQSGLTNKFERCG